MKRIFTGLTIAMLAGSALASDVEVNLNGRLDFQAYHRHQKNLIGDEKLLTNNRSDDGFYTKAGLNAMVTNTTDCGMTYGANVVAKTATRGTYIDNHGSYIFAESNYGRLEAGSTYSAMANMAVSGYSISSATGDDWPAAVSYGSSYLGQPDDYGVVYVTPHFYGDSVEEMRSVTYYTPKMYGVQFGVSYIPDSTSFGDSPLSGTPISTTTLYNEAGVEHGAKISMKDIVSVGMTLEHDLSDEMHVKLGAGYQHGKNNSKLVSQANSNETLTMNKKLKLDDYRLYNFGALLSYGNWSVAGSYADAGKSLTNKDFFFKKRQNKFYTGAVAFNNGPVGLSLTYLRNNKYENKLDSYTLGTDYVVAPGLKPYAEVTSFKFKDRGYKVTDSGLEKQNTKKNGMVYILGTKVTF